MLAHKNCNKELVVHTIKKRLKMVLISVTRSDVADTRDYREM
jgi:hypothetical protein